MTECKWEEEGDYVYNTSCGLMFEFIHGSPKDNEFNYCPYCAGLLIDITEVKP